MKSIIKVILVLGSTAYYFLTFNTFKSSGLFFVLIGLSLIIPEFFVKKKKKASLVSRRDGVKSKKMSNDEILNACVDTLSGTDFEKLIAMYYKDKGYKVELVGGSGDHEVDLILLGKEGYKIAVQCKRWRNNVGNDIVLRLKAGKQIHGCYDAWIVTTSNFTKAAREAAERLNIKLINGLMLYDMLDRWKKRK